MDQGAVSGRRGECPRPLRHHLRQAKNMCGEDRGVGRVRRGVYLDFADEIERLGRRAIEEKYGNLFHM